jgi:hypothetical protein
VVKYQIIYRILNSNRLYVVKKDRTLKNVLYKDSYIVSALHNR